jgi:siroheme synthase
MGRKHIGGIAARLRAAGMEASLPAAAIESASLAEQRTIRAPLGRLAEEVMRAAPVGPVLLLVGEALAE